MSRSSVPRALPRSASRSPSTLGRILSLPLALALSAGVAGSATAQEVRTATVTFASASASANGYLHGSIRLRYTFDGCGDVPQLFFSLETGSARGYEGYWYEGKFYGLQADWTPPAGPELQAPMRVMFAGGQVPASDLVNPVTSPISCSTGSQYRMLGQWRDFIPAGGDREAAIKRFTLEVGQARAPLRSDRVEQQIRAQIAAAVARARTDSLDRARLARDAEARRLAAARADSIAKADAARRSAATAPGVAAGARPTTSSTTSSTTSAAQVQRDAQAAEQRQRDAAAEAAAQRDREAERARMIEAERQRAQAAQAAQEQQMVAAVEATTVAAIGIFESIAESRRVKAEKRRREYEAAGRRADAAATAYAATVKARFDAAPPRPACAAADVRDSLVVSRMKQERKLRLTGAECRLSGGQSAIMMMFIVDADAPVEIKANQRAVLSKFRLIRTGSDTVVMANQEGGFSMDLERGRYVLEVSTRMPGEVGELTLSARKLWVSDAQGTLGGAMGPAKRIDGFVGTNQTSSAFMDLNLALQHRRGLPYLVTSMTLGTDTDEAGEFMIDVGLRQYFGRSGSRVSPWIEASMGYRSILVRQEPFTTVSPAFGAGVNFRMSPGYGLALSATQITGSARNTDDIWTSTPPPVPLGRTIIRLGWMIY